MLQIDFKESKEYVKVLSVNEMDRISLTITDANLIKDVLVRHFSHFMDRRPGFQMKYKSKFLTQLCGSEWKHTSSPTLTSGKIRAMLYLMKECLEPMMNRVLRNQAIDFNLKRLLGSFPWMSLPDVVLQSRRTG